MGPQICGWHAEGWQRNCRSLCCWQRKTGFNKILSTGGCHVLCILSSRLLPNVHWSCLNSRRIPNKVVSRANAAQEKHPETLDVNVIPAARVPTWWDSGPQGAKKVVLMQEGAWFGGLVTPSALLRGRIRRGVVLYLSHTSGGWNTELFTPRAEEPLGDWSSAA